MICSSVTASASFVRPSFESGLYSKWRKNSVAGQFASPTDFFNILLGSLTIC